AEVLAIGTRGGADVLLVDEPTAQGTVRAGIGREAQAVLSTDVVLLGPATDPAHLAGRPVLDALRAIAATGATFVSRRDGLDANRFELALWQSAMGRDVQHEGWYVSTHQGGAPTLLEASRRQAYTLSDRATYLAARDTIRLQVLRAGDPALCATYSLVTVLAPPGAAVNRPGAQALAAYLHSPAGRQQIAAAGVAAYGESLFVPADGAGAASP
ncbi:MAG TPA: tungsten ABC transporter substrate-binding protein, partial [Chloroflexia bacterium]|nr:tungsten ABC transporter substrate-binding protein [Chloroflexia bacterium]